MDVLVGDSYQGVLLKRVATKIGQSRVHAYVHLNTFQAGCVLNFREACARSTQLERFRADVTVGQKHWSNGSEKGPPYLIAKPSSIVRDTGYTPEVRMMAVKKPGTVSGRAHDYEVIDVAEQSVSIFDLRAQAYHLADMAPPKVQRETWQRTRSAFIAQYALCRSRGNCEGCKHPAPFMRRNGEPYLEVHHIHALGVGGPDHPLNVAAVCPNCHGRVTHGIDADGYNAIIANNVKAIEALLESQSR